MLVVYKDEGVHVVKKGDRLVSMCSSRKKRAELLVRNKRRKR